ncbi:autotransporter outer membrane beta-barrel domain-containing protein [Streptococcus suis]|uniref:autotransporter outer membrane beta-barrel domain-containing protein n=1 Tax=Streptococcus suis TaxID=1307 RepID=UPI000CF3DF66|nr:autotransporter outer membrane beta-barrel domain-containing protein [Streptococcus suis]
MSFINQFKSQSKTVLAAVAISAATFGFAGGMSISKSSTGVSTQNQASLAQNNSAATNGQVAASANTQGMPPGQSGASQGMPPGQGGPSQGTTPPDATSGATQSNSSTSSDEVNALKKRNQEIKAQISGDSSSSNQ